MPWRQGMKVCLWRTTKYVLVAFCILSSLCTIQGQCPSGWQEGPVDQRCFMLMNNVSSWNESANNCKAEGGQLASVESSEEFFYFNSLCIYNGSGSCWLGATLQRSSNGSGFLTPNWTDCRVPWNGSFYAPPGPVLPSTRNCSDSSCPDYDENVWCSLVVNASLVWGRCGTKHPFICSLGEGSSCGRRSSQKEYIIILSVVSSVILTTTLGVAIWLLAYRRTKRRRRRRRDQSSLAAPVSTSPWRVYTFSELVRFTDGFAPENKLGRGDSGSFTYKGLLPNGSAVAIKKVRRPGLQGEKDFLAEMRKIGRLRHENLVAMKGCCFDRNDGYIVYEFIPNSTLEGWIHNLPSGARPLDWDARMRIAQGVADSLAYLHDKVKPNVVHRNVRASTVLLDNEFKPHLLGVGLINMALRDTTHEPTVIVGTHGYLAPEFVYRNELTTRSDIFSFGVLLLELVTGRKPTVAVEGEVSEIPTIFEWATPLFQAEAWTELLDESIGTVPNYSQVKKVVELAYTCTQHVPSMRPRMSHVLYQLEELQRAELMVQPINTETTTIQLNTESLGVNTTDLELEIREVPL